MRIVKEAQVRKNEILDAAEALFEQQGFDQTSTADILKAVGIARGTLYYHFKSKEEILDAAIERLVDTQIQKAAAVIADREIPFLVRLPAMFAALNRSSEIGDQILVQVHRPQNALMHQKTQEKLLAKLVPILNTWVEEGIEQGLFHTDFSTEALEMALLYAIIMFDDLNDADPMVKQKRIMGLIYNLERMLGCESGLLQEALMAIFNSQSPEM